MFWVTDTALTDDAIQKLRMDLLGRWIDDVIYIVSAI